MRNLFSLVFVSFIFCSNLLAFSAMNYVPAVTGKIVDESGNPVSNATITVTFKGLNGSVFNDETKLYTAKTIETQANEDGVFKLERCVVNILKIKHGFHSAFVDVKAEGFLNKRLQVINMRVAGGAIGVFIFGMLDSQGEFDGNGAGLFGAVAAGYKTMKESKFSRVYKEIFKEAIVLKVDKQLDNFHKLHNE